MTLIRRIFVAGVMVLLLAACGERATPTQQPTQTTQPPTQITRESTRAGTPALIGGPTLPLPPTFTSTFTPAPATSTRFLPTSSIRIRMTLPASWTPTPTPTVTLTPTITLSPVPTITPSPTATRTLAELCDGVVNVLYVSDDESYTLEDKVRFVIASDDPGVSFQLTITHKTGDETTTTLLPAGIGYVGNLTMGSLFGPGEYVWTVSVQRGETTGLCEQSFAFTIRQPTLLDTFLDLLGALATVTPQPTTTPEFMQPGIPDNMQATLNALMLTPQEP